MYVCSNVRLLVECAAVYVGLYQLQYKLKIGRCVRALMCVDMRSTKVR